MAMTILAVVFAILVMAAKLGVLVLVFVRTRRPASLCYGLYLLLMNPVGNAISGVIAKNYSPTAQPEAWASSLWLLNQTNALIETSLFIWLLWPLLKRRSRSKNVSS